MPGKIAMFSRVEAEENPAGEESHFLSRDL